jgi:hypothetical protein
MLLKLTALLTLVGGASAAVLQCLEPVLPSVAVDGVESVTVTPDTIFLNVGDTGTATCTPRTGSRTLTNACTWVSRTPATASVPASGQTVKITALRLGNTWVDAKLKSKRDSLRVIVRSVQPPPPPPPDTAAQPDTTPAPPAAAATCFDSGAATITLTGLQPVNELWDRRNHLPAGSRIDARGATWRKDAGVGDDIVRFGPGPNNCFHGGQVIGLWDKATTDWEVYHGNNGFTADGPRPIIEDVYVENYGDATKFMGANFTPSDWTVRRVWGKDIFDDFVENDWQQSGTIEDVLCEGCFTFLATRDRVAFPQAEHYDTITVDRAIIWHKGLATTGEAGRFWKIDIDPNVGGLWSPVIRATNNVVRMDPGQDASRYCLDESNIVRYSVNNTLLWTGPAPFVYPASCGGTMDGWNISTYGAAAVTAWNAAAAQWKAAHPSVGP